MCQQNSHHLLSASSFTSSKRTKPVLPFHFLYDCLCLKKLRVRYKILAISQKTYLCVLASPWTWITSSVSNQKLFQCKVCIKPSILKIPRCFLDHSFILSSMHQMILSTVLLPFHMGSNCGHEHFVLVVSFVPVNQDLYA